MPAFSGGFQLQVLGPYHEVLQEAPILQAEVIRCGGSACRMLQRYQCMTEPPTERCGAGGRSPVVQPEQRPAGKQHDLAEACHWACTQMEQELRQLTAEARPQQVHQGCAAMMPHHQACATCKQTLIFMYDQLAGNFQRESETHSSVTGQDCC